MTQDQTKKSTASTVFVMGARKRLLAFTLDCALATTLVSLLPSAAVNGERLPRSVSDYMSSTVWISDFLWFLAAVGTVLLVMGVLMETTLGWTIGKKLFGGKVVKRSGETSGLIRNCVRNALKGISLAMLGLGQLWAFFDKDRRTMYDKLTGVMVIRAKRPTR